MRRYTHHISKFFESLDLYTYQVPFENVFAINAHYTNISFKELPNFSLPPPSLSPMRRNVADHPEVLNDNGKERINPRPIVNWIAYL